MQVLTVSSVEHVFFFQLLVNIFRVWIEGSTFWRLPWIDTEPRRRTRYVFDCLTRSRGGVSVSPLRRSPCIMYTSIYNTRPNVRTRVLSWSHLLSLSPFLFFLLPNTYALRRAPAWTRSRLGSACARWCRALSSCTRGASCTGISSRPTSSFCPVSEGGREPVFCWFCWLYVFDVCFLTR